MPLHTRDYLQEAREAGGFPSLTESWINELNGPMKEITGKQIADSIGQSFNVLEKIERLLWTLTVLVFFLVLFFIIRVL